MEIEVKYQIPNEETADAIWNDAELLALCEIGSRETVGMKAVYFDTPGLDLSAKKLSFRARAEGDEWISTVKWGGGSSGSLHERNEINVPFSEPGLFIAPSPSIFKGTEAYGLILEASSGRPLVPVVEMRFERRRAKLRRCGSLMELAVDRGFIITERGSLPISELEIELLEGDPSSVVDLGKELAEKHALSPQPLGKLRRGLMIL